MDDLLDALVGHIDRTESFLSKHPAVIRDSRSRPGPSEDVLRLLETNVVQLSKFASESSLMHLVDADVLIQLDPTRRCRIALQVEAGVRMHHTMIRTVFKRHNCESTQVSRSSAKVNASRHDRGRCF